MLCLLLLFLHYTAGSVQLYPPSPKGIHNHTLEVRVTVSESPFQSCSVSNGNVSLSEKTNGTVPGVNYGENESKSTCSIMFSPMEDKWKGTWTFNVTDSQNKITETTANVGLIEEAAAPVSKEVWVQLGGKVSEKCHENIIYGKLYNPRGELVAEDSLGLGLEIASVRVEDQGTWTCELLLPGWSEQTSKQIILRVTQPTIVTPTLNETTDYFHLLWKVNPEIIGLDISHCFFETPKGTMMVLEPGVLYPRYNYYGAGLESRECGVSIPKPLTEEDVGIWRMGRPETSSARRRIGGFIAVPRRSGQFEPIPTKTNTPAIKISRGMNLTVECSARASLRYCYLKSPSGRIYSVTESNSEGGFYVGQGLMLGDCKVLVPAEKVNTSDSGTWQCGMGVDNIDSDLEVAIQVKIYESNFTTNNTEVWAEVGSQTKILCSSSLDMGLDFCKFNRPNGGRFRYLEEGLEHGICGVSIEPVKEEDFGIWTCSVRIIGQNEEYSAIVVLSEQDTSSKIGLSVGVAVVLFLIVISSILLYVRYRKKMRLQDQQRTLRDNMAQNAASRIPRERLGSASSEEIDQNPPQYVPQYLGSVNTLSTY